MSSCALVGASDFNREDFSRRFASGTFDAIYAVDGGFRWLQGLGITPNLVLGDFDSLGFTPTDIPVESYSPMKDASDMELALARARADGNTHVVVYGGLGGRLDHTIANLSVFAQFSEEGMQVSAVHEGVELHVLTGPGVFHVPDELDGGTVSVFSLSDVSRGVNIRGLLYALADAELTNRTSRGLSNEIVPSHMPGGASVSVEAGSLAIVVPLVGA